jgi:hypothetical protein
MTDELKDKLFEARMDVRDYGEEAEQLMDIFAETEDVCLADLEDVDAIQRYITITERMIEDLTIFHAHLDTIRKDTK